MSGQHHSVKVNLTFRNIDATDALHTYATEKVTNCLQKFIHQDTEAHVVLKVEKLRQIAEVSFHCDGADFKASEEAADLYAAIDALVNTISHQLRKHKEKLVSHHK